MTDRRRTTFDGEEWTQIARTVDVSERQGFRVEIDIEHDLALFRVQGTVRAVTNVCPHKRIACIYDGIVDNGAITCPMHAWRFDLTTGDNVNGGGGLRVYAVREVEGGVWVRSNDID